VLAVLQRVVRARVRVEGQEVGGIGLGYCLLVCAVADDGSHDALWLADKVADLRLFEDASGRTNLALSDVGGGVLLVPQFTLAADWRKGRRPAFTAAAPAELARRLLGELASRLSGRGVPLAQGRFGADMELELVNQGPFTLLLDSRARPSGGHRAPRAPGPSGGEAKG